MSYRGWQQEAEDHVLIAAHPEIFSSFYSVPLPHLDREFVKELRDFLLCAQRAFRRLLLGLHQDRGDVVSVFEQWREWRIQQGIVFSGGERTLYYAQETFASDFFRFLREQYIPMASAAPLAITALLECEEAVREQGSGSDDPIFYDKDELLAMESRPQLLPGIHVITLAADYQEIVRRLRQGSALNDVPQRPVKLAIRKIQEGEPEVRQLTPLSAELLDLCAEGLTVQEMRGEFILRGIELAGVPPEKLCLAGLEILRQQRLIF
jgi:hypothetical protein